MKKPYILILSISIAIILFFALLTVFKGVTDYIVGRYQPEYITPSPKDSLYMKFLNHPDKRDKAILIAKEVESFYFLTDSVKTILDANISQDLISEIIINKGLAEGIRQELLRLDSSQLISCIPQCLESQYRNRTQWDSTFIVSSPENSRVFLQEKINLVVEAEKNALQLLEE